MNQDHPASAPSTAVLPFTATHAPGQWPSDESYLPMMLTDADLAHLKGESLRSIQRKRRSNQLGIPSIKDGRGYLYARADVLKRYGARST